MGVVDEVWNCPHCGEEILRSAASCPACQRRLRFGAVTRSPSPRDTVCPLSIHGIIRHPGGEGAWEYSVLVEVHDSRGEKLVRRTVGVGTIPSGEVRNFTLRVEMYEPEMPAPTEGPSPPSTSE